MAVIFLKRHLSVSVHIASGPAHPPPGMALKTDWWCTEVRRTWLVMRRKPRSVFRKCRKPLAPLGAVRMCGGKRKDVQNKISEKSPGQHGQRDPMHVAKIKDRLTFMV